MTDDYIPGMEDAYFTVKRDGRLVHFEIFTTDSDEKIVGIKVLPETARELAQKLTMTSWKAEE